MDESSTPPSQESPEASLEWNADLIQQISAPNVMIESKISATSPVETGLRSSSPSVPDQEAELPLFVPQDDSSAVEMQLPSETSNPTIKEECPMTPPSKLSRYSSSSPKHRFSSGVIDLTEDGDEEKPPSKPARKKVIEITSDGEFEDIDPSPRRQKRIKRESRSPKYHRKVSEDVEDVPMQFKDEELPDDPHVNMNDEDASDSSSAEAASAKDRSSRVQSPVTPRKERKSRKPQGKRARTAREWHQRNQAKLSETQLRGTAYKLSKIEKIREDMKKGIKTRKVIIPKRRSATRPDPRVFLNGGSDNLGHASAQRDEKSAGGQPELHASTRKGFWKEFAEKHHNGVDLHQCQGDWNDLVKGVRSLGLGQLYLEDGKWRQPSLTCCKLAVF